MPAPVSFHDIIAANDAYQLDASAADASAGHSRLTTCRFVAHALQCPALPELVLLASHEYQLSTALVDLGWGYHDHFSSAPHPLHLVPPQTPFRWIKDGAARVTFLSIDQRSLNDCFAELGIQDAEAGLWRLASKGFANPFLYTSILTFAQHASSGSCPRLLADSYCVTILHALAQQWRQHDRTPSAARLSEPALQRVLALMQEHLADDISLAQLATVCGMSKYHFTRCFKASTGVSPYQYLLQRRIERTKTLLQRTQWPLTRIAAQVGYQDPDALARQFRRQVGLTPSAWREQH